MNEKRKLATIEKITELKPIPDADNIEVATIRGWKVVVKKGEFKEGDLCVYCEVDSLLPDRPEFEFLRNKKFRIKTIKLKGQVSQGIAFPLHILENYGYFQSVMGYPYSNTLLVTPDNDATPIVQGEDVTDLMGITKYEPPIPAQLAGKAKGAFPSHSVKTDEERIENLKEHYDEYRKYKWWVTQKLDGSSMTCYVYENTFGIASRNLDLIETEDNTFWKVARDLKIEEQMRSYMERYGLKALTLQGELIGEGIQKNRDRIRGQTVKFFRSFDPMSHKFHDYETFLEMMKEMDLPTVPVLERDFVLPENYEDLLSYADGRSSLSNSMREGIVLVRDYVGGGNNRLSFKVISKKYLLKFEE